MKTRESIVYTLLYQCVQQNYVNFQVLYETSLALTQMVVTEAHIVYGYAEENKRIPYHPRGYSVQLEPGTWVCRGQKGDSLWSQGILEGKIGNSLLFQRIYWVVNTWDLGMQGPHGNSLWSQDSGQHVIMGTKDNLEIPVEYQNNQGRFGGQRLHGCRTFWDFPRMPKGFKDMYDILCGPTCQWIFWWHLEE